MQTSSEKSISRSDRIRVPASFVATPASDAHVGHIVAVACATFMLLALRMPMRLADGFLWAEDSPLFLKDAGELGLASIFKAYAGYFHLLPRLIAYVQVQWVGMDVAPYTLVWLCAVLTALSSATIFAVVSRWQVFAGSRRYGAVLFALAPIIIPQSGEVYLNITNLQWIVAPMMLVLVIEMLGAPDYPQRLPPTARWIAIIVLFVLVMTGPFALIFLPFALLLMAYRRADGVRLEAIVFLVACAFQLGAVLNADAVNEATRSFKYLRLFSRDFVGGIFYSEEFKAGFSRFASPLSWLIVGTIAMLTLLSPKRLWILALLGFAVSLWAIGVLRVNDPASVLTPTAVGARYYFVPEVLLVWALTLLCMTSSRWLVWIPWSLLAMLLTTTATQFPVERFEPPSVVQKGEDAYTVKSAPQGWGAEIEAP